MNRRLAGFGARTGARKVSFPASAVWLVGARNFRFPQGAPARAGGAKTAQKGRSVAGKFGGKRKEGRKNNKNFSLKS